MQLPKTSPHMVSLSGLDGAGKTTQVGSILRAYELDGRRVLNLLESPWVRGYERRTDLRQVLAAATGHDVIATRFYAPSAGTRALQSRISTSELLDRIEEGLKVIRELASSAARDAWNWYQCVTRPLLDCGCTLVFDRYFHDEVAYRQLYGMTAEQLEELYRDFPAAACSIFLDVSIPEIIARNSQRPDGRSELLRRRDQLERLKSNFQAAAQRGELMIIDGDGAAAEVRRRILDAVNPHCAAVAAS